MSEGKVLVAGIGNVFRGDDGFGVAVVAALRGALPAPVTLLDIGIRAVDLGYTLLEGWDTVILVDASPRGHPPGTVTVLEPLIESHSQRAATPFPGFGHSLDVEQVLESVTAAGAKLGKVRIVGCEPLTLGTDEEGALGLSAPVEQAVVEAAELVKRMVTDA